MLKITYTNWTKLWQAVNKDWFQSWRFAVCSLQYSDCGFRFSVAPPQTFFYTETSMYAPDEGKILCVLAALREE